MGWERTRGMICQFNSFILTGKDEFRVNTIKSKLNIKYVITLDADTNLSLGTAKELIGAMAHILNTPVIDKRKNINTLGRDGSDTTAVAIAAKMKIDKCYIYSDVNGIYTQDPNKVKNAKKFNQISYKDMQNLSNKGSRVIHSKCIDIAEEYHITIIAKSTFDESEGTIITDNKL